MKENKLTFVFVALIIILGIALYVFNFKDKNTSINEGSSTSTPSQIVYNNTDYGFNFTLPTNWQGYSIIKNTWTGNSLKNSPAQSGVKIIIRNPKWTVAVPYEDLPILIFTISQWNLYLAEDFAISAAPIQASELARNNMYVFALPPRWDFDYSLGFEEAQGIFKGNPIKTFNVETKNVIQGKLNINIICERSLSYMTFADAKSAEVFVAECKEGKHPEVIEKYKTDMNLGDGVMI